MYADSSQSHVDVTMESEMPAELPPNASCSRYAFLDSEDINVALTPISEHTLEAGRGRLKEQAVELLQ
ncbi:hypothetical protein CVT26_015425 [Gymnopilus dilepis]|uniref:Uncharacterized protein n=1 Tax=Gymnopilus dilepis TaxID=231916 RepID=A0A409YED6_9AGAR|nr:hypothetical protein CVT26_015425 [Gymnopilus dilepis]